MKQKVMKMDGIERRSINFSKLNKDGFFKGFSKKL